MKATAAGQAQVYASPQTRADRRRSRSIPNEILNLTTYLAVVDKDHNMVSITSSLLSGFGSGIVVDKGGFLMNDRMRYFYLDPKDVNSLQPGKRIRQTINPAMALKDGKPWIAFGTPGSDTQPQTQLQFFLNVAEFGMNVQEALEQPTVISNSFRDSYQPHDVKGKLLTPALLPQERAGGAGGEGASARHPQREGRRIGEGDPDRSADRRADGRRQPDRRQLRHGVVRRVRMSSDCGFVVHGSTFGVRRSGAQMRKGVTCSCWWPPRSRLPTAADNPAWFGTPVRRR